MVYRAFSQISHVRGWQASSEREHDLKLPVDAHPCSAPAESASHRSTEAAYTAICIASMNQGLLQRFVKD